MNDKTSLLIGYARKSPADAPLEDQLRALKEAGVKDGSLFVDEFDLSSMQQPSLEKAIERAQEYGGTLVVTRIGLLGVTAKGIMRSMWTLREQDTSLRAVEEPIQMDGPIGAQLLEMLLSLFRTEHDLLQAGIRALNDDRPKETRGRRSVMTPEREKIGLEALRQGQRGDPVWRMLQKVGGPEAPNLGRSAYFRWQRNQISLLESTNRS